MMFFFQNIRSMRILLGAGSVLLALTYTMLLQAQGQPLSTLVKTPKGSLQGSTVQLYATEEQSQLLVFRGIPYAAAPTGNNRWRAPQIVPAWAGVRPALESAARCVQGRFAPDADQPLTSEDCLYLNLWTPAKHSDDKLPVLVWIHGGGFIGGAGSDERYDGAALANKGAVVISINYRLGPFGFFAHPDLSAEDPHHSSGNYAILDQLAALHWVKDSVAAFGGDPERITLMGESAGAKSVATLLLSPLTTGLLHGAILQSAGWMGWSGLDTQAALTLDAKATQGSALARELGLSLAELRQLSTEEVMVKLPGGGQVAVDGYLLPKDPSLILAAGEQQAIPVMTGSNEQEALFFGQGIQKAGLFKEFVIRKYANLSDNFLELYPANDDTQANMSYLQAFTDEMSWQQRKLAQYQRKLGQPAWVYFFTRTPPGETRGAATHVSELAYMFNHAEQNPQWTEGDKALGNIMAHYWVNFAATGNPNISPDNDSEVTKKNDLPKWPAFTGSVTNSKQVMELELSPAALQREVPSAAALELFDLRYEDFLKTLAQ
jgi:para-nitrobenzyl esterase